ncbi:MAG: TetR/AcrR family transcriptional regulator [Hyphomonadaceae bacterium]|nr:TetR/AcrR family transcriptional regulator [Hyphomonadaceae bacterium]
MHSPAPRWRRRAEARPDEILEAALTEFDARGFEAARMEDIARRAGLSKAAIYLYFPSKTALLEALIEAKVAPLAKRAEVLALDGDDHPLAALRGIAEAVASLMADPRVFAVPRLVIGISGRFPEIAAYYRRATVERARQALERLIKGAIEKGAIRAVDPSAVVRSFIGPLFFEAMWTHALGGESALADPKALIDQHFDILVNGLENRA